MTMGCVCFFFVFSFRDSLGPCLLQHVVGQEALRTCELVWSLRGDVKGSC